jgi:hypothetical protein
VGQFWRLLPLPGGHSYIGPRPRSRGPIGVTTTLAASRSSTLR